MKIKNLFKKKQESKPDIKPSAQQFELEPDFVYMYRSYGLISLETIHQMKRKQRKDKINKIWK